MIRNIVYKKTLHALGSYLRLSYCATYCQMESDEHDESYVIKSREERHFVLFVDVCNAANLQQRLFPSKKTSIQATKARGLSY